jgi:hypothetical protein
MISASIRSIKCSGVNCKFSYVTKVKLKSVETRLVVWECKQFVKPGKYLFVCGLFKDAVNSSAYIESKQKAKSYLIISNKRYKPLVLKLLLIAFKHSFRTLKKKQNMYYEVNWFMLFKKILSVYFPESYETHKYFVSIK